MKIKISRNQINLVLRVAPLLLAISFLRPTVLGSTYTTIGLVISISTFIFFFLQDQHPSLSRSNILIMVFGALLFIFLFFQGLLTNSFQPDFVIKSTIANILIIVIFGYFLSYRLVNKAFFKALIILWAFLGFSTVITIFFSQIISLNSLYLFQIPIKDVNTAGAVYGTADLTGNIYLPFSLYYKHFSSGFVTLHRFMIMFREPGIAQAFLIWGIVYALHHQYPRWTIIGLTCGVVTTFSTSGISLLIATSLLWFFSQTRIDLYIKTLAIILSFVFSPIVLIFTPYVGLIDKIQTHGVSIEIRLMQISEGLITAFNHPLGVGYYSQPGTGINLLSTIGQIGLVGFILSLIVYIVPLISSKTDRAAYLIAIFPIFTTLLIAQPIFDAPLVYIMLFAIFPNRPHTKLVDKKNISQPLRKQDAASPD